MSATCSATMSMSERPPVSFPERLAGRPVAEEPAAPAGPRGRIRRGRRPGRRGGRRARLPPRRLLHALVAQPALAVVDEEVAFGHDVHADAPADLARLARRDLQLQELALPGQAMVRPD